MNCLFYRVYDEAKCRRIWRLGATPCALPPTDSQLPYLNSLGDTAIDFVIAPPRVVVAANENNSDLMNDSLANSMNVSRYLQHKSTIEIMAGHSKSQNYRKFSIVFSISWDIDVWIWSFQLALFQMHYMTFFKKIQIKLHDGTFYK